MTEATLKELRDPKRYPGAPTSIQLYQTHLSVVCIAGDRVYKLKKPVRLPFVDFSTLEKRHQCCRDEVALNRRLCPDLYLGVVPLYGTPTGVAFAAPSGSRVVDYAVHMRRLPADRMMDVLVSDEKVGKREVEEIAKVMAAFHRTVLLEASDSEARATPERLQAFAEANFEETAEVCGEIFDPELHAALKAGTRRDFAALGPLMRARVREGRVVDGHGDLHTRNICLGDPLAIYDCIEFNRSLRIQDVAAENAFLVMDLRYRGQAALGTHYLDSYIAQSGDLTQRELIPMLVRYRAMVRAKVAALAAGERELEPAEREASRHSARRHMNLAAVTAVEQGNPLLLCACGLPASGKSHLFEAIAGLSGWPCLSTDRIRKERAGIAMDARAPAACYTPEAKRRTYEILIAEASKALETHPVVMLDANFGTRDLRSLATHCGADSGAKVAIVFLEIPEHETKRRMAQRKTTQGFTDADMEVFRKLAEAFQPPSREEGVQVIRPPWQGDTSRRIAALLAGLPI